MTPDDARNLQKWCEGAPLRLRRYILEGGTRQGWKCHSGCGCYTDAETVEQGRANLDRFCADRNAEPQPIWHLPYCTHADLRPTGHISPPIDFS